MALTDDWLTVLMSAERSDIALEMLLLPRNKRVHTPRRNGLPYELSGRHVALRSPASIKR